jgi:hypothetical protein
MKEGIMAEDDKKRTRSPAYPFIDLQEAFEYAKKVHAREGRHPFALEAAAEAWEFKPTSSAVSQIISALKQFGLLTEDPGNGVRRVKLSPLAIKLIHCQEGTGDPKILEQVGELLQTAALSPKIHREIWEKYGGDLPSDASLRIYLLTEREVPFNRDFVDRFISNLRSTIGYAKLSKPDKLAPADDDKAGGDEPERKNGADRQPDRERRRRSMAQGTKEATLPLDTGEVVITWPDKISPEEIQDVESWFQLMVRRIKRSSQTEGEEEGD